MFGLLLFHIYILPLGELLKGMGMLISKYIELLVYSILHREHWTSVAQGTRKDDIHNSSMVVDIHNSSRVTLKRPKLFGTQQFNCVAGMEMQFSTAHKKFGSDV
jgi:hypothetical protein